jgi:site-specific recombinase XerD
MTSYIPDNTKRYNLYNFEHEFKNYLLAGNANPITLKNYLSDFRHFWGWLSIQSFVQDIEFEDDKSYTLSLLTSQIVSVYKNYLINNALPYKTVNRRLSTLRRFCTFCVSQGWLKVNPAKEISNTHTSSDKTNETYSVVELMAEFKSYLETNKYKASDRDKYLSVSHEFLSFMAK